MSDRVDFGATAFLFWTDFVSTDMTKTILREMMNWVAEIVSQFLSVKIVTSKLDKSIKMSVEDTAASKATFW